MFNFLTSKCIFLSNLILTWWLRYSLKKKEQKKKRSLILREAPLHASVGVFLKLYIKLYLVLTPSSLNPFDLPSSGSELREIILLRPLLMCLEKGRVLEVVLPGRRQITYLGESFTHS